MEETEGWSNAPVMDNPRGEVGAYKIDQRTRIIRLYLPLVSPLLLPSPPTRPIHSPSASSTRSITFFLHSPPALLFYFIPFNDFTWRNSRESSDKYRDLSTTMIGKFDLRLITCRIVERNVGFSSFFPRKSNTLDPSSAYNVRLSRTFRTLFSRDENEILNICEK